MKLIISTFLLTLGSILSINIHAQCDQKLSLTSSKTEYLNASGDVRKTVDELTGITISDTTITIAPENDRTMTGRIRSVKCTWPVPFKVGQTELKTEFEDQGAMKNITIVIEGKNGKISFLATFDDNPDKKIRVWADSFKATK